MLVKFEISGASDADLRAQVAQHLEQCEGSVVLVQITYLPHPAQTIQDAEAECRSGPVDLRR